MMSRRDPLADGWCWFLYIKTQNALVGGWWGPRSGPRQHLAITSRCSLRRWRLRSLRVRGTSVYAVASRAEAATPLRRGAHTIEREDASIRLPCARRHANRTRAQLLLACGRQSWVCEDLPLCTRCQRAQPVRARCRVPVAGSEATEGRERGTLSGGGSRGAERPWGVHTRGRAQPLRSRGRGSVGSRESTHRRRG